jgi:hypothetical protein
VWRADERTCPSADSEHGKTAYGVARRTGSPMASSSASDSDVRTVTPATFVCGNDADGGSHHVRTAGSVDGERVVGGELGTDRAATATVLGMSCSLRSRETGRGHR